MKMNPDMPLVAGTEFPLDVDLIDRVEIIRGPTQSIPIMVLTARAMASDRAKAFTAGCDDFDTEPIVDFWRLVAKIESLLLPEKTT